MKNKLNLLRILYLCPLLLLIGLIEVPVGCEQCGVTVLNESIYCRIASRFDDNYLCGMECALDYLRDNPLEYDENGEIIRKW
jgi:hypothetical protein